MPCCQLPTPPCPLPPPCLQTPTPTRKSLLLPSLARKSPARLLARLLPASPKERRAAVREAAADGLIPASGASLTAEGASLALREAGQRRLAACEALARAAAA